MKSFLNLSDGQTLGTLYRELISVYPDNDEELLQKRDHLQDKLGFCLGGKGWAWPKVKCPPELLFGPLVTIAYKISLESHNLKDYRDLFNSLMTDVSAERQLVMQKTAAKILSLAMHFKETKRSEKLENIPDLITVNLVNQDYLSKIGLHSTNATSESDCWRVGGGTKLKAVSRPSSYGYNSGAFRCVMREVRIPVRHRKRYYQYRKAQDGKETLRTFSTYSPTA